MQPLEPLETTADSIGNQINVLNIQLQNEQDPRKNKQPNSYFTIFEWEQTGLSGQILRFLAYQQEFPALHNF